MPSSSNIIKLGQVLDYEQPTKYIVSSTIYNDAFDIPVLTAGQTFILGYTDEKENVYKQNLPVIIFDDFTTATQFVEFPFKVKSSAMKILKTDPKKNDIRYLFYLMQTIKADTNLHKRYWISQYANIVVNLPSLKEQKKIAGVLDKAQELIKLRKQQIEKLDLLIKSKFLDMFGDPIENPKKWEKEKLGKKLKVIGGYAFSSMGFVSQGIPVLRIGNINSGVLQVEDVVSWPEDTKLEKYMLSPGDIVLSLTGTVGKEDYANVCILSSAYDKYYLNQRNAKLEIIKDLNKYYLSYVLKVPRVKKMLTGINRGVRQANISNSDILNLLLPIPPENVQNKFGRFVEKTEKHKVLLQKSLNQLETNYKSLMQQFFE